MHGRGEATAAQGGSASISGSVGFGGRSVGFESVCSITVVLDHPSLDLVRWIMSHGLGALDTCESCVSWTWSHLVLFIIMAIVDHDLGSKLSDLQNDYFS